MAIVNERAMGIIGGRAMAIVIGRAMAIVGIVDGRAMAIEWLAIVNGRAIVVWRAMAIVIVDKTTIGDAKTNIRHCQFVVWYKLAIGNQGIGGNGSMMQQCKEHGKEAGEE